METKKRILSLLLASALLAAPLTACDMADDAIDTTNENTLQMENWLRHDAEYVHQDTEAADSGRAWLCGYAKESPDEDYYRRTQWQRQGHAGSHSAGAVRNRDQ